MLAATEFICCGCHTLICNIWRPMIPDPHLTSLAESLPTLKTGMRTEHRFSPSAELRAEPKPFRDHDHVQNIETSYSPRALECLPNIVPERGSTSKTSKHSECWIMRWESNCTTHPNAESCLTQCDVNRTATNRTRHAASRTAHYISPQESCKCVLRALLQKNNFFMHFFARHTCYLKNFIYLCAVKF